MDANIFQFGQNPLDDVEALAVGEQYLYLLIKNILK